MKIVLSVVLVALLMGCSDETKETKTEVKANIEAKVVQAPLATKENEEKKSVVKKVQTVQETAVVEGNKVFMKCASCHGEHAEKKALNKSQVIQGWSVEKVTTAINGYKNGTYGSSMKGVMKAQVSKLSSDEVEAVSEYISKL